MRRRASRKRDGGLPVRVERAVKDLASAGERLGLSVTRYYVGSADELAEVFDRMARGQADVVIAQLYWLTGEKARRLVVEQAARARLPTLYSSSLSVDNSAAELDEAFARLARSTSTGVRRTT
jgi:ABC-type uncharacterized transport system substrate-binding protein